MTQDSEVVKLLQGINDRLATLAPTTDEMLARLDPQTKQAVFFKLLENTSLAEVIELERTDPYLIALRKERKEREIQNAVNLAKLTGASYDDMPQKIAAQFARVKKVIEAK